MEIDNYSSATCHPFSDFLKFSFHLIYNIKSTTFSNDDLLKTLNPF